MQFVKYCLALANKSQAECCWPSEKCGRIQSTLFDSMQTFLAISLTFGPDCIHTTRSACQGLLGKKPRARWQIGLDLRNRKMHDQIWIFNPAGQCKKKKKREKKSELKGNPRDYCMMSSLALEELDKRMTHPLNDWANVSMQTCKT